MWTRLLDRSPIVWYGTTFILLGILGSLAYANSIDVPFYYDDNHVIVNRESIRDLGLSFSRIFSSRGVPLLSFAINYALTGVDVWSYHLVNILLHILAAFLVLLLVEKVTGGRRGVALFVSFVFLLHPLQTQAVTYITQRMAVMACLFSLGAILFHLAAVESDRGMWRGRGLGFLLASLGCSTLALLSKEHVIVLPALLLLCESRVLSSFSLKSGVGRVLPVTILLVLIAATQFTSSLQLVAENRSLTAGQAVSGQNSAKQGAVGVEMFYYVDDGGRIESDIARNVENVRWRYAATELRVLGKYVALFVFPVGLLLDYSWPLVTEAFSLESAALLSFLGTVLVVAFLCRRRRPLVFFSLAWIFFGLLVESSVIPLDPIFEHRMYLPLPGFALLVQQVFDGWFSVRWQQAGAVLLAVLLLALTVQRNAEWNDPVVFWQKNYQRVPYSPRVTISLAEAYIAAGQEERIFALLEPLYAATPWPGLYRNSLFFANMVELGKAYFRYGRLKDARAHFVKTARWYPDSVEPLLYLGALEKSERNMAMARFYLEKALALEPENPLVLSELATITHP